MFESSACVCSCFWTTIFQLDLFFLLLWFFYFERMLSFSLDFDDAFDSFSFLNSFIWSIFRFIPSISGYCIFFSFYWNNWKKHPPKHTMKPIIKLSNYFRIAVVFYWMLFLFIRFFYSIFLAMCNNFDMPFQICVLLLSPLLLLLRCWPATIRLLTLVGR